MISFLITWTTYGTWLPGNDRGFVSNVKVGTGPEVRHNIPGTAYDADDVRVRKRAESNLIGESVWLTFQQAKIIEKQLLETAQIRGWHLHAWAIMSNHVHIVVSADTLGQNLLHDFKSYSSRALNTAGDRPAGARWWTESGSRRILPQQKDLEAAIEYVQKQERPLIVGYQLIQ